MSTTTLTVKQVKQAPQFRTSDNQVHSDRTQAKLHEAGLALFSKFTQGTVTGIPTEHAVKAACMAIAKNFGNFKPIFDAINRVR